MLIFPSSPSPSQSHPLKRRRFTLRATASTTTTQRVIVIGAGLAGLASASKLNTSGVPFLLLDSSSSVGGRVRTDAEAGFLLDRGFQIFITAYPESNNLLEYDSLNLQRFYSGARIFYDGSFYTVSDPTRHFVDSIGSLTNPIGTLIDKLLIGLVRIRVSLRSNEEILSSIEESTIDLLRKIGFSNSIIDRFFRPFFGGIFFDPELETTSRLFNFIFKCLALGDNALPAKGIGEIANQLASKLPLDSIKLNSRVSSIEFDGLKRGNSVIVRLENVDVLETEMGVVLAVEEPEAERLLKKPVQERKKPGRSTVCLYFTTDPSGIPNSDPILYLNGSGTGIVNNMFFVTNVAPSYGPPGKGLVSVSLIGSFDGVSDDALTAEVVGELSGWFGESVVRSWRHFRTYQVRYAQPDQTPPTDLMKSPRVGSGVYACGDYMTSATFDGALVSGGKAVEALLQDRILSQVSNPINLL